MRKRIPPNHQPAPFRILLRPLSRRYLLPSPKNRRAMLQMPLLSDLIPDGLKTERPSTLSPIRSNNRNNQHNHNIPLTILNSIRNPRLPLVLFPRFTPTVPHQHWWPAKAPTVSVLTRPRPPHRKAKRVLTPVVVLLRCMLAYPPVITRTVTGPTDQLPKTVPW